MHHPPSGVFAGRWISLFSGLLHLDDKQMRRDGPGPPGQRCDGKRGCIAGRVANSQNGVDGARFHNRHSCNLRGTGCSAHYRIRQIGAIECQQQLTSLVNTYLKQNLIGPDLCQTEGTGSGSGNPRAAVWPILGKTDVCAGGNRRRIVRRHQCVKICIVQDTARRSLRTGRSGCASGPKKHKGSRKGCLLH